MKNIREVRAITDEIITDMNSTRAIENKINKYDLMKMISNVEGNELDRFIHAVELHEDEVVRDLLDISINRTHGKFDGFGIEVDILFAQVKILIDVFNNNNNNL